MDNLISEEAIAKYEGYPKLYVSAHPSLREPNSSILLSHNVLTNKRGQWFVYTAAGDLQVHPQGLMVLGFGWKPRRFFLERDRAAIETFLRQFPRPQGNLHDWTAAALHALETRKLVHFFE